MDLDGNVSNVSVKSILRWLEMHSNKGAEMEYDYRSRCRATDFAMF